MIAYLFRFNFHVQEPDKYLLVYAETEDKARDIGAAQCRFYNDAPAKPEDLKLCTYGL